MQNFKLCVQILLMKLVLIFQDLLVMGSFHNQGSTSTNFTLAPAASANEYKLLFSSVWVLIYFLQSLFMIKSLFCVPKPPPPPAPQADEYTQYHIMFILSNDYFFNVKFVIKELFFTHLVLASISTADEYTQHFRYRIVRNVNRRDLFA